MILALTLYALLMLYAISEALQQLVLVYRIHLVRARQL